MLYNLTNTIFSSLNQEILTNTKTFTCGNKDLDNFFYEDCIAYANNLFGKSYCFQSPQKEIIAAFTVSNASIFTNRLPNARRKKISKNLPYAKRDLNYPAVLIGRLGINIHYQNRHIGSSLLDFIKAWFTDNKNKTGCRYLVVDAYNTEKTLLFYQKNGFDFIFGCEEQEKKYRKIDSREKLSTRLLYFDLIRIV